MADKKNPLIEQPERKKPSPKLSSKKKKPEIYFSLDFVDGEKVLKSLDMAKGGSVKKKKSSGKAIRGKGCEIR